MSLNLIDIYSPAIELWEKRDPTLEELITHRWKYSDQVRTKLRATIGSAMDAAIHIAREGYDRDLYNQTKHRLEESCEFKAWRRTMPSKTPKEIEKYQCADSECDLVSTSNEIAIHGQFLPQGQRLFHGGGPGLLSISVTDRPLSTSLSLEVALRNATLKGKAYHANRIDLFVLEASDSKTPVFVMNTDLADEKEVLFGSGAQVKITSSTLVSNNYRVSDFYPNHNDEKNIPIYVHTALIS